MIKIKEIGFILVIFFIVLNAALSQDFPYSQFYANPLYLNPALAGTEYCPRITTNYRNQWPSLPGTFVAYSASFDRFSEFFNGGLGLQINYDKQGEAAINNLLVSGMYAYRLTISRSVEANLALQAGYGQRSADWNELLLPSGLTGGQSPAPEEFNGNVNYVDFGGGFLMGIGEKYFLGGAVHHVTQPNIGFFENQEHILGMKITIHAGANFGQEDRYRRSYGSSLEVSPNILYQQQHGYKHLNAGSYFSLSPFVLGLWFRHAFENSDAVIILLGLQQDQYRFGYSYDYTVSQLSNAAGGAHEVSFSYIFPCDKKSKRPRAIKCPSF
ncbi:MAG: PorP/SprF family type IX secretion system membrane protein [Bacteroidales bacterium]|nr:PorP/SprF family type IX secretion system membrane protein [Bacteroidales bacterium]